MRVLRGIRDLALGLWWTVVINHIPGTFPWYVPWWALLFTAGLLIGWWTA